ncbi:hypothetical protein FF1_027189 [Malus domestica]
MMIPAPQHFAQCPICTINIHDLLAARGQRCPFLGDGVEGPRFAYEIGLLQTHASMKEILKPRHLENTLSISLEFLFLHNAQQIILKPSNWAGTYA